MNREIIDFLNDILSNAEKIIRFTINMEKNAFMNDVKTLYATVRAFEIIGEATKRYLMIFDKNIQMLNGKKLLDFGIF